MVPPGRGASSGPDGPHSSAATRAALISDEKAFPRHGYEITSSGKVVGTITSGTVSPILEKAIAMGYVDANFADDKAQLNFLIRNKEIPAKLTKLPFVKK
jgi:aminomethyltransferase